MEEGKGKVMLTSDNLALKSYDSTRAARFPEAAANNQQSQLFSSTALLGLIALSYPIAEAGGDTTHAGKSLCAGLQTGVLSSASPHSLVL